MGTLARNSSFMAAKKAATWESRARLSMNSGFVGSRPSLATGAFDSSTASLPFKALPGKRNNKQN